MNQVELEDAYRDGVEGMARYRKKIGHSLLDTAGLTVIATLMIYDGWLVTGAAACVFAVFPLISVIVQCMAFRAARQLRDVAARAIKAYEQQSADELMDRCLAALAKQGFTKTGAVETPKDAA